MAKTIKESYTLRLRLTCVTPPERQCEDTSTEFGLQDRHQMVHPGQPQADGSISYEISITVTRYRETNALRFLSPYVHGTPATPFLYLSWKCLEAWNQEVGSAPWIRRLKIPLPSLTWDQIEATPETNFFAVCISGTGSGTVPLLDGGWTRQSKPSLAPDSPKILEETT